MIEVANEAGQIFTNSFFVAVVGAVVTSLLAIIGYLLIQSHSGMKEVMAVNTTAVIDLTKSMNELGKSVVIQQEKLEQLSKEIEYLTHRIDRELLELRKDINERESMLRQKIHSNSSHIQQLLISTARAGL